MYGVGWMAGTLGSRWIRPPSCSHRRRRALGGGGGGPAIAASRCSRCAGCLQAPAGRLRCRSAPEHPGDFENFVYGRRTETGSGVRLKEREARRSSACWATTCHRSPECRRRPPARIPCRPTCSCSCCCGTTIKSVPQDGWAPGLEGTVADKHHPDFPEIKSRRTTSGGADAGKVRDDKRGKLVRDRHAAAAGNGRLVRGGGFGHFEGVDGGEMLPRRLVQTRHAMAGRPAHTQPCRASIATSISPPGRLSRGEGSGP